MTEALTFAESSALTGIAEEDLRTIIRNGYEQPDAERIPVPNLLSIITFAMLCKRDVVTTQPASLAAREVGRSAEPGSNRVLLVSLQSEKHAMAWIDADDHRLPFMLSEAVFPILVVPGDRVARVLADDLARLRGTKPAASAREGLH